MRRRMTVLFSGTVQGVGFRALTHDIARDFKVDGYVKNLSDGQVELVAEGTERELGHFLKSILESRLGGYIRSHDANYGPAQGSWKDFHIEY